MVKVDAASAAESMKNKSGLEDASFPPPTASVAAPAAASVDTPATDPVAAPAAASVDAPTTDPVAASVDAPTTDPVDAPAADPVDAPAADPVTELKKTLPKCKGKAKEKKERKAPATDDNDSDFEKGKGPFSKDHGRNLTRSEVTLLETNEQIKKYEDQLASMVFYLSIYLSKKLHIYVHSFFIFSYSPLRKIQSFCENWAACK